MKSNPFKGNDPRCHGFCYLLGYNSHIGFCKWIKNHKSEISNVLEVGCGYFDYYSYFFNSLNINYTGLDINQEIIDYRKSLNSENQFICIDFNKFQFSIKYDLVYCHMVPSGLRLNSFVKMSRKYGYGVFWETTTISLEAIILQLKNLGCKNISVFYVPTQLSSNQVQNELVAIWEQ